MQTLPSANELVHCWLMNIERNNNVERDQCGNGTRDMWHLGIYIENIQQDVELSGVFCHNLNPKGRNSSILLLLYGKLFYYVFSICHS